MTKKQAAGFSIGVLVGLFGLDNVQPGSVAFWIMGGCILLSTILYIYIDWEKEEGDCSGKEEYV